MNARFISVFLILLLCISAAFPGALCAYADGNEQPADAVSPMPEASAEPEPSQAPEPTPSVAPAPEDDAAGDGSDGDDSSDDEGDSSPSALDALRARIAALPAQDSLGTLSVEELDALCIEIGSIYDELDALFIAGDVSEDEYTALSAALLSLNDAIINDSPAPYIDSDISDADALIAMLSSGDTAGKQYKLTEDITVDAASLPDSVFAGRLDGAGKTIRITGTGAHSLFGFLGGTADSPAGVSDLNLVFDCDVYGAPLAADVGHANISGVNVTLNKNVLFSGNNADFDYAAGLFAVCTGGNINAENVSVTCLGTIGSVEATNARLLLAAGLYADVSDGAGSVTLSSVTLKIGALSAVSGYGGEGGYVCAAGAAAARGGNVSLADINLSISADIRAARSESGTAEIGAFGLGNVLSSVGSCSVDITGSIIAEDTAAGDASALSVSDHTQAACGLAYQASVAADAVVSVKVGGDILAANHSAAAAPVRTLASGGVYWAGVTAPWSGASITVSGRITASAKNEAVAVGFMANELDEAEAADLSGDGSAASAWDFVSCRVEAKNISAVSEASLASAAGFAYNGYSRYKDCAVNVTEGISSSGKTAVSAGFTVFAIPTRANDSDTAVMCDGCTVNALSVSALGEDSVNSAAAGFAYKLGAGLPSAVRGCSVTLSSLSAPANENAALFACINEGSAGLTGNHVSLNYNSNHILTIDGLNYARFTAYEAPGQTSAPAWAEGNTAEFSGISRAVLCAFDSGTKPAGHQNENALWRLTEELSLTFDANGHGEAPKAQLVLSGSTAEEPEAPAAPGFEFLGWFTDKTGQTAFDFSAPITQSTVLYAKWQTAASDDYKVEHYLEAADRDADGNPVYELKETETKSAPYGSSVTAAPKTFPDHHVDASVSGSVPSGTVEKDGSLVLKLYYPYDTVKYTYNLAGGTGIKNSIFEVRKGSTITLAAAPTRDKYTFGSWTLGTKKYYPGDTVTLDRDSVFTAAWTSPLAVDTDKTGTDIPTTAPTPRPTVTPRPVASLPPSNTGVHTGDTSNLVLWGSLLALSAVGAAAAVIYIRRKK